jgi:hypothetical protein
MPMENKVGGLFSLSEMNVCVRMLKFLKVEVMMKVERGKPPEFVQRSIHIEMTRDEVLSVLLSFVKRKLANDSISLDNIQVIGNADAKLETMTISGLESVPLRWTEPVSEPVGKTA